MIINMSPRLFNRTCSKYIPIQQYQRYVCTLCVIFICVIFLHGTSFAKETTPVQINAPESTNQADKPQPAYNSNESFGWGKYLQAIGTTLFLLVLLWYGMKILRKYGNGRFLPAQKPLAKEHLYLEGQIPLGNGKGVVVVKVLDKRLILGVTEHSINLLTEADIQYDDDNANFQDFMEKAKRPNEYADEATDPAPHHTPR